jgi:hypothetical protein
MTDDLKIPQYRKWIANNVTLRSPLSINGLRELVLNLFLGRNYRFLTERGTEEKLFITYIWIMKLCKSYKAKYGKDWQIKFLDELIANKIKSKEKTDMTYWLLGLTHKTAANLQISNDDLPAFLAELLQHCRSLFKDMRINSINIMDEAWLLLMAGAATLNIRGSQKAKVGKALERVFLKAALTILGMEYGSNFWLNIGRDIEVEREADAEVQTKRGRIRIEIGLISSGNQEVIEDKINRVGENGVVIFDKIGARSRIYETAKRRRVCLIQIRHNQPLIVLHDHLQPLVNIKLIDIPSEETALRKAISKLPDALFGASSIETRKTKRKT